MTAKHLLKTIFIASVFVTVYSAARAQSESELLFGFYGGVNTNSVRGIGFSVQPYNPNQQEPTPVVDGSIPFFENYTPALGIFVNYPITATIDVSGRFGYNIVGGELDFGIDGPSDTAYTGNLSFKSHNLEFSPTILFKNIFLKNLYILAGGEFGFPISDSYNFTQRINANNLDTNLMLAIDQPMSKNPLRLALVAGAGYNFNAGNVILLAPELTLRAALSSFDISPAISNIYAHQLRFTLNVSFLPENQQAPENNDLRVFIDTVGTYQSDGNFTVLKALQVEDVQYSELYPLVPYVFFPKSSSEPAREFVLLKADERGAAAVVLKPDALEINQQLLNVIGTRMKTEYPGSVLKITGTTDGKTETKTTAQQRADFAKEYLLKTFGIAPGRISTESRALPLKPSVTTLAEGDAENRRIEFSSSTPELLAPISMAGDKERIAFPELVEFRPYSVSADSITEWTLSLSQSGKTLREYKGTGSPRPQRWLIRPNELTSAPVPVDYTFSASTGKVFKTASGSLPVDYISSRKKSAEKLADKTISKYSLILFDFDKAELTPENQKIVETTIFPALKYNSTVKIYGYTDKLGEEKYNRDLSLQRARSVHSVLKAKVPSARYEVLGSGESTELFDNNSPIGRHLSRTVMIIIETPR